MVYRANPADGVAWVTPMTVGYEAAVRQHRFDLLLNDGVLGAVIETVDEGDQLLIENIAVAPSFQRQGLGQRLLAHTERIASLHPPHAAKAMQSRMIVSGQTLIAGERPWYWPTISLAADCCSL